MQITHIDSRSRPGVTLVDLPVSSSGMVVTVGAGDILLSGVTHTLADDATATLVSDPLYPTFVTISLCLEAGTLVAVVDEQVKGPDGADPPFAFAGSPYERVHQLAYIEVAPGLSDLDTAPATVWRVLEKE